MEVFKISCHSISKIMAGQIGLTEVQEAKLNELQTRKNDAAKGVDKVKPLTPNMENELALLIQKRDNPELPKGAKTYVKEWIKRKLFRRKKEWRNNVIDKGLAVEDDAIALMSEVYQLEGVKKNEEWFENEYMQGIPDVNHELVRDTKSSWDLFTFPMFDDENPNPDYEWQLQGYMILTGKKKASLDYVLIDTPFPIIQLELKKLYYQSGGTAEDWTPEKHDALIPNYQFNDIQKEYRVKSFEYNFEPEKEQQIIERVELCRKYVDSILNKLN
jgi:hypothetical protein